MSKQKELTEKYENIRKTMKDNLYAIRTLLDQADSLTQLVEETSDPEMKKRLSDSVEKLYRSIDDIVEQSTKLFDKYLDFAKTVADD